MGTDCEWCDDYDKGRCPRCRLRELSALRAERDAAVARVKELEAERETLAQAVAELVRERDEARRVAIRRGTYRDGWLPDDLRRLSDYTLICKWEAELKGGG